MYVLPSSSEVYLYLSLSLSLQPYSISLSLSMSLWLTPAYLFMCLCSSKCIIVFLSFNICPHEFRTSFPWVPVCQTCNSVTTPNTSIAAVFLLHQFDGGGHYARGKKHRDDWPSIKGQQWLAFKDGKKYERTKICGTSFVDAFRAHGHREPEGVQAAENESGEAGGVGGISTDRETIRLHASSQGHEQLQHAIRHVTPYAPFYHHIFVPEIGQSDSNNMNCHVEILSETHARTLH